MKSRIGKVYDDLVEMQEDLECRLEGEVYFGDIQQVPFNPSVRRMEIYNDTESYMLEFMPMPVDADAAANGDEPRIKLVNVYD